MKINAAFAKSLLLVSSLGLVLPMLAKPPAKPAPAVQGGTAKPEGEEPEATIPGVSAPRANGGFIGITVDASGFKLAFYDSKKKPVDCDVAHAAAHWKAHYTVVEQHCILNPSGDGKTLTSPPVRPPYNFKLYLTLLSEDDTAIQTFTLDIRG